MNCLFIIIFFAPLIALAWFAFDDPVGRELDRMNKNLEKLIIKKVKELDAVLRAETGLIDSKEID